LESLAADAAGVLNSRNRDEWAAEYGYDNPAEATRTYLACKMQTERFKRFCGDLWCRGELPFMVHED